MDVRLPKFSIITPSYNQGEFIEETILSIKNQDYPGIEHIIVDGGSTDNTLAIIKKYESTYNMRWVSEADKGQADAINKGFDMADGDIISWLNSDDIYIDTGALSKIATCLGKNPETSVITAGGIHMSERGERIRVIPVATRNKLTYRYLRCVDSVLQPATFFKKQAIDKLRCDISLRYAFDWDLFIRLAREQDFLALNELIAGYRIYGRNKTTVGGAERAAEIVEVNRRYLGRWSWQYYIILAFYFLLRITSRLPQVVSNPLQRKIRLASGIISILSFKRVMSV
jgi:glycosyltransferase involved in cell wall biosynthesis